MGLDIPRKKGIHISGARHGARHSLSLACGFRVRCESTGAVLVLVLVLVLVAFSFATSLFRLVEGVWTVGANRLFNASTRAFLLKEVVRLSFFIQHVVWILYLLRFNQQAVVIGTLDARIYMHTHTHTHHEPRLNKTRDCFLSLA